MREIYKRITIPIDGASREFRLCKLDAFSGAHLLQLVRKYLPATDPPQSNLPKAEFTHSTPAQAGPNPPQAPKQKTEQTKVEKGSGPTVADLISPTCCRNLTRHSH